MKSNLNKIIILLLSSFIFKCNAIDERAFKSLETQVSIIQQKILALHKIKELEDALDDQKSLVLRKSEEINNLNDEIELLKQQKVANANDFNQKFENQLKSIQAEVANNNVNDEQLKKKNSQEIQQLNILLSTKSEENKIENQNQNAQIEQLKSQLVNKGLENKIENQNQNTQIEQLKSQLENQDLEIKTLSKKNKNLENVLADLQKEIQNKNELLKTELTELAEELNEKVTHTESEHTSKNIPKYSLAHDVSIVDMKLQGFKTVYNFPYSHATKLAELHSIKSQCSSETLLCVGGAEGDNLLLVSCGDCETVLTETKKNQPVLNNGAYWYLTKDYSFGFSPIYNISLEPDQDTYECNSDLTICPDNKRLSWIVYKDKGGWRLGNLNDKSDTTKGLRKIMMLDSTAITPSRKLYSLAQNVSIFNMKSQGYRVVYDFPYSYNTTSIELMSIKTQCSDETILCAGGAGKLSDNLELVSCGNCLEVLTSTLINTPNFVNGAYWYLTDGKSFGFSPQSSIKQNNPDVFDCTGTPYVDKCSDEKRLSWYLSGIGGYRLGIKINIFNDSYRKLIFLS